MPPLQAAPAQAVDERLDRGGKEDAYDQQDDCRPDLDQQPGNQQHQQNDDRVNRGLAWGHRRHMALRSARIARLSSSLASAVRRSNLIRSASSPINRLSSYSPPSIGES